MAAILITAGAGAKEGEDVGEADGTDEGCAEGLILRVVVERQVGAKEGKRVKFPGLNDG